MPIQDDERFMCDCYDYPEYPILSSDQLQDLDKRKDAYESVELHNVDKCRSRKAHKLPS